MQWYLKVLREYANFEGRARRTEFWMFVLFYTLGMFLCVIVDILIGVALQFPIPVLTLAYYLGTIVPVFAVSVRRLHDTDRSGAFVLLSFVPFGNIVLFVFFCLDGTPMPNRYGPSPKAVPAYYPPNYAGPTYSGPTYA